MPRCIENNRNGKRCKKNAIHLQRCMWHYEAGLKSIEDRYASLRTYPMPPPKIEIPEITWCGHQGCELWDKICCACADKRPHREVYTKYVDGYGDLPIGSRDDGYCYTCQDHDARKGKDERLYLGECYMQTMDSVAGILSTYTRPALFQVLAKAAELKRIREESK